MALVSLKQLESEIGSDFRGEVRCGAAQFRAFVEEVPPHMRFERADLRAAGVDNLTMFLGGLTLLLDPSLGPDDRLVGGFAKKENP